VDLAKYPLEDNEDESVCVTLDAARIVFLTPSEALLSLRDGALYLLRLDAPAGVVDRLSVVPTRLSSVVSTCLVVDEGRRFLFQGSRLGDSLLLRLNNAFEKVGTALVVCALGVVGCSYSVGRPPPPPCSPPPPRCPASLGRRL
jgi:hypothetical protein